MKIIYTIKDFAISCIPPFLLKYPIVKRIIGFSFVGVFVTIIGMTLTFIGLKVLDLSPYVTYFSSYVLTVMLSYYLNSRFVFKSGKSKKNLLIYYGVYSTSMLIGLITLWIYHHTLPYDELLLNYMVIPVTMAWNFTVSSRFLKPQNMETLEHVYEMHEED
jgi:putative flippase GtrA